MHTLLQLFGSEKKMIRELLTSLRINMESTEPINKLVTFFFLFPKDL